MAINFSSVVYLPCFDVFARPIMVTTRDGASYAARGIYHEDELEFLGADGESIISTQKKTLDVREAEFSVLPQQGDLISIPAIDDIPQEGLFEVVTAHSNGGGETNLVLRKFGEPQPDIDTTGLIPIMQAKRAP